jgi:hypothetical protein
VSASKKDDRIVETLLGPELAQRVDGYIARDNPRLTRSAMVKDAVATVLFFTDMRAEQLKEKSPAPRARKKIASKRG